jgi:CelD/BcsL family acetyltransferase involved in cellulose biosynthesis
MLRFPALPVATDPCPFITLPGTFEAYLAGRSKSFRAFLRKRERQIATETGARPQALSGEDAVAALEVLFELHRLRWEAMGRSDTDNLARPIVQRFHRRVAPLLAERGLLRLHLLMGRGGPVAALYGFRDRREGGGWFSYFQCGHHPDHARLSPGVAMLAASIRAAIAEGCAGYDFLRGDEGYKARFQTGVRFIATLRLAAGVEGRALLEAERAWRWLRAVANRAVAKSHGPTATPRGVVNCNDAGFRNEPAPTIP